MADLPTEWKSYERKGHIEAAPWVPGFDMTMVSLSQADQGAGHPKEGGMIARNKDVHDDMWYIAQDFFETHYAPRSAPEPAASTTNSVSASSKSASPGEPCERQSFDQWYASEGYGCDDGQVRLMRAAFAAGSRSPEPRDELQEALSHEGAKDLRIESLEEALDWAMGVIVSNFDGAKAPKAVFGELEASRLRLASLSETKGAELRDCICSDPENCREPVPGRRCKAGLSVNGSGEQA